MDDFFSLEIVYHAVFVKQLEQINSLFSEFC